MKKSIAIAALAIVLGACRVAPTVYSVSDAPISTNVAAASKEDVRKAIIRAGAGLGWSFKENGPDALVGTLIIRTHTAVIDIPYNTKSYSIMYKDSTNLNYNGTSIHANYNGWIKNLQNAINAQLQNI